MALTRNFQYKARHEGAVEALLKRENVINSNDKHFKLSCVYTIHFQMSTTKSRLLKYLSLRVDKKQIFWCHPIPVETHALSLISLFMALFFFSFCQLEMSYEYSIRINFGTIFVFSLCMPQVFTSDHRLTL